MYLYKSQLKLVADDWNSDLSTADVNIPRSKAGVAIGGSAAALFLLVVLVAAIIYKRGQPMWRRHSNCSSTISMQMSNLDNVSLGSNSNSIATVSSGASGTSA